MKRILAAAFVAISLTISSFAITGSTVARAMDVTNDTHLPTSGTIVNPCTGEAYAFSGYFHLLLHVTGDQAGGFHVDIHDNAESIKLVGLTSGTQGVGTETDHFTINLNPGASNETSNGQFSVNTQGSAPNFVVQYLLHITVNANGTITSVVDTFTAQCRG